MTIEPPSGESVKSPPPPPTGAEFDTTRTELSSTLDVSSTKSAPPPGLPPATFPSMIECLSVADAPVRSAIPPPPFPAVHSLMTQEESVARVLAPLSASPPPSPEPLQRVKLVLTPTKEAPRVSMRHPPRPASKMLVVAEGVAVEPSKLTSVVVNDAPRPETRKPCAPRTSAATPVVFRMSIPDRTREPTASELDRAAPTINRPPEFSQSMTTRLPVTGSSGASGSG